MLRLAAGLALALALCAPASAATIEVDGSRLEVLVPGTADSGRTGGQVRTLPDGGVMVSLHGQIPSSAVTIGPGCASTPPANAPALVLPGYAQQSASYAATCSMAGVQMVEARLNNITGPQGWGSATVGLPVVLTAVGNTAPFAASGDVVVTGAGGDTITLTDDPDSVDPGTAPLSKDESNPFSATANTVRTGGGADKVDLSRATGRDVIQGGNGIDGVSYATRFGSVGAPGSPGVVVTLNGTADDGVSGELDNIAVDVENLTGTRLEDRLEGDGDGNRIEGLEGVDTLRGFAGPDVIVSREPGALADTGTRDSVTCGLSNPGLELPDGTTTTGPRDTLLSDLADPRPIDCEDITQMAVDEQAAVRVAKAGRLSGRVLAVVLACPKAAKRRCAGTLRHTGAATRYAVASGRRETVRVRVSKAAARAAARKALLARLESLEKGNEGDVTRLAYVRMRA